MTRADRFATQLLDWYVTQGRHDLPWQKRRTPYRVWISEIMLQQTQVATVIPYYRRFMRRFGSVHALAAAPLDDVLHLWSGLGYYSRARNLHGAALQIVEQHAGRFPRNYDDVVALPGIGPSTAGAILALACGQRHPILDGNVRRVLARVHEVAGDPSRSTVQKSLWSLADAHTPRAQVAEYTQAIMDLGATVCVRGKPACDVCPVDELCGAQKNGTQSAYPGKRVRKEKPVRQTRMLLVVSPAGDVLLERRPPSGIWGGLWSFPEAPDTADTDDAALFQSCAARTGSVVAESERWAVHRHTFTHFHLDIRPQVVRLSETPVAVADSDTVWYNRRSPATLGLAAPVQRLLGRLFESNYPVLKPGNPNH